MPNPQESLRALLGGGSNIANSRVALRQQQLSDPRTSGAFRDLVGREDAAEAKLQAADPIDQRYQAFGDAQTQEMLYDRPGQQQQREDALARTLAPIQARGGFDLQREQIQNAGADQRFQQSQDTVRRGQDLAMDRAGMTQTGQATRQRLGALQTGKAHAPRPANEGLLGRFFTGPSQQTLDEQEIASLQGGGGDDFSGGETIRAIDPNGVIHNAPAGTPLPEGWELIS